MFSNFGTAIGDFFLCLFLAPLGILRIIHRNMKNKQNLIKGGEKILVIAGVFITVFFILIVDPEMLTNPFTYLYASGGIVGIVFGIFMIFTGIKYGKYKSAVEKHNLFKVKDIANMLKQPEETAAKTLIKMISDGFFPELKFDVKTKTLLPNESALVKLESKTVVCDSCGAKGVIFEGKQNKCEYCGDVLNY